MTAPEGTKLIAGDGIYTVFEYEDWYYLRGLGKTDYVFEKDNFHSFALLIRVADTMIQGESE